MKKFSRFSLCILLIFISLFILVGCGSNSPLDQIEKSITNANNTISNLDDVASEDMSGGLLGFLIQNESSSIITLSTTETIPRMELETTDSHPLIDSIIQNHTQIREKQMQIFTLRTETRVQLQDLKAKIKSFKDSSLELTEEEKTLISNYVQEVKSINTQMKNTIGNVYRKMRQIRNRYNLANLELINDTLTRCNNVMTVRLDNVSRLQEIIIEVNTMLENKLTS